MESDSPEKKEKFDTEYEAWCKPLTAEQAKELAAMTDERALEIIRTLRDDGRRRQPSDWSGLVEQQAIFHGKRRKN